MNYQFIGQIKGAKIVSRKDKTTQATISNCEVIIQFEDYDKNGELVLATNTIPFHVDELQNMKDNVQKFICVHHLFLAAKSGTYLFPDENMNYQIFDTNPLVQNSNTKDKKAS